MANRQSIVGDAGRFGDWLLKDIGRELRVARLTSGLTQRQVGQSLGRSNAHVSRVEAGLIKGFGIKGLCRHAAVVGLKPWIALFPRVARPLDRAQLTLLARFRERIAGSWQVIIEAAIPIDGDLRAADALLTGAGVRCMVEVITRLADVQAQVRSMRRKQRDLMADRLILVIAGTTTNRRALGYAAPALLDTFPMDTKATLRALAAGVDPGADGIVVL
jgi:transcriptional regulator with XRE-family HTH domain